MSIQQIFMLCGIAMLTGTIWKLQRKHDKANALHEKQIEAVAKQLYLTSEKLLRAVRELEELKNKKE